LLLKSIYDKILVIILLICEKGMKYLLKVWVGIVIFFSFYFLVEAATNTMVPAIHFSDIVSGPSTGNTDAIWGNNSSTHGSVVTLWWNGLWNTQGTSKIYIKDSWNNTYEAAHTYYWKNADGTLPWWPSDLYSVQKMTEIAFSLPSSLADGPAEIYIDINWVLSNEIDFLVRSWNIYFVDNSWNDSTWDGSFSNPWQTLDNVASPGNAKLIAGDIVYLLDFTDINGIKVWSKSPNNYMGTETHPFSIASYPGNYINYISNIENPTALNRNVNNHSVISNHWNANDYWNFSKLRMETNISGIRSFYRMRAVGNEFFWPDAEWTGGAITGGWHQGWWIKVYWNYVHDFWNIGTSNLHHIFYISNRTTIPTEAYELSWNHLKDNGAPHGLHIFDQNGQWWNCWGWAANGPWSWTWKFQVKGNAVHNQRGCGFDYSGWCGTVGDFTADVDLSNNMLYQHMQLIIFFLVK